MQENSLHDVARENTVQSLGPRPDMNGAMYIIIAVGVTCVAWAVTGEQESALLIGAISAAGKAGYDWLRIKEWDNTYQQEVEKARTGGYGY